MSRFLFVPLLLFSSLLLAQQPVYTLYYTNPLPVNPAFTGSAHQLRAGANFRNQWTNFVSQLTAYSVFADHYFDRANSGAGIYVYTDVAGSLNYRSTSVSGFYSYRAKLKEGLHLTAGIQPSFGQLSMDGGKLLFNDQLSPTGRTGEATAESITGTSVSFFNLNSGLLFTAHQFWLGATAYNLLRPKAGYTNDSKLPIGVGIQTGFKTEFRANAVSRKEKKERFLMPHLAFSSIGTSKQLYVGTELVYDPISIGGVLRGNYFATAEGTSNINSFAISIGFRKPNVQANYSYDIPISGKLGLLGPSHEIAIRTLFKVGQIPTRRPVKKLDLF